jgi:hypothetical protein
MGVGSTLGVAVGAQALTSSITTSMLEKTTFFNINSPRKCIFVRLQKPIIARRIFAYATINTSANHEHFL